MSRIKSIYYYGLCYVKPYDTTLCCLNAVHGNSSLKYCVESINYGQPKEKQFTVDTLKEYRAKHGAIAKHITEIQEGDIDVFILTTQQLESFYNDMDDFNLKQYIVYQSPPFVNRNYISYGKRLHMFILHYKDYAANA